MKCEICNGLLILLGVLGRLAHLQCRDCGMECSIPADELPEEDVLDDEWMGQYGDLERRPA